jgi:hypothetical protein
MEQANSKYKLMKEQATWNAPSEQEEKILALMTKVRNLKKFKKKEPYWKKEDKQDKNKPKSKHKKAVDKPLWFQKNPTKTNSPNLKNGMERPGTFAPPKWEASTQATIECISHRTAKVKHINSQPKTVSTSVRPRANLPTR